MAMISVDVGADGPHEYASGITVGEVIKNVHGRRSGAIAALVDGEQRDMSFSLEAGCSVDPILGDSEDGLFILRHSCAHLLAQAVTDLYPDAKPTIGPPIEHGFYYDFGHMDPIGEDELRAIGKRMKQLVKENLAMVREEHSGESLREMFSHNPFKLELMDDKLEDGGGSSIYRQGEFVDLCRGPHVPSTSHLRWFKLTSTSTAFWRADSSRENLVRIYGMCYASKEDLRARETLLREAGARDHRKLGRDLQLFHIDEMVGQGLVLWTPRGSVVRQELQDFIS